MHCMMVRLPVVGAETRPLRAVRTNVFRLPPLQAEFRPRCAFASRESTPKNWPPITGGPTTLRLDSQMGTPGTIASCTPSPLTTGALPPPEPWLDTIRSAAANVRGDFANYYSAPTLGRLATAVALAAPLANTSLDHDVRDWWQDDIRGESSDDFAAFWKNFGEGDLLLPVFGGLALCSPLLEGRPLLEPLGDWGSRTTRAYLVGGPPMLLMQYCLGASRPGETHYESRWKPLDDVNAVSGHAFIGAVPFITAAQATENRVLRACLYGCSTLPAWSRVNDDAHYLSQICLGWYMAYLACRSVDRTERELPTVEMLPLAGPEFNGLGLLWRR